MRKFFQNRLVLSVLFFCMGGLTTYSYLKFTTKEPEPISPFDAFDSFFESQRNNFWNDNFADPFKTLEQMNRNFSMNFNTGLSELSQKEDEDYVYYELQVEGLSDERVTVSVNDQQVSISAKVEKKTGESNSQSFFSSSFHKSFPLPEGVNPLGFEVDQSGDTVTIKFPKLKT